MTFGPSTVPSPGPDSPASPPTIPGLELIEVIGRGGFGTVYRARQVSVNREVAVKVDRRELTTDSDRRRFLREMTATGQVSAHPHIVTLYDGGISPSSHPYMVMELCPGGSLNERLKNKGRFIPPMTIEIGIAIADALAAAHEVGILHRDVKPANILYTRYDKPALADFGLASLPTEWGIETMSKAAFTPAYAPPEVFINSAVSDSPHGDVFSLGATLYSLLIGRPARWTDSGPPSLSEIVALSQEPLPILEIPGAPGLMDVLTRATWPDPKLRTQTAATFRDELQWALSNLDPTAAGVARAIVPPPDGPAIIAGAGTGAGVAPAESPPELSGEMTAPALAAPGSLFAMPDGLEPATQLQPELPTLVQPGGSGARTNRWASPGSAVGEAAGRIGAAELGAQALDAIPAVKRKLRWPIYTAATLVVSLAAGGTAYYIWQKGDTDPGSKSGANGSRQNVLNTPTGEPEESVIPVGQCSRGFVYISGIRQDLRPIECTQIHYHESFATGILDPEVKSAHSDDVESDPVALATCTAEALEAYAGRAIADPTITIFGPTGYGFKDGDRGFSCMVATPEGERSSSLKTG